MTATAMMMAASATAADAQLIDKPDFTPTNGQYDIAALEALGRVSAPVISPDGKKLLYGVSYESVEQNKSNLDLYVMNLDGTNVERLTKTPESESGYVWIDGGRKIAFMNPVDGKMQLWVMNADGSDRKAVSAVENGIQGFLFSPDEKRVVMIGTVKYSRDAKDIYPDLQAA